MQMQNLVTPLSLLLLHQPEFADEILEGIDPLENKEEWQKILEMYGLDETNFIFG